MNRREFVLGTAAVAALPATAAQERDWAAGARKVGTFVGYFWAFSPDGRLCVSSDPGGGPIRIRRVPEMESVARIEGETPMFCPAGLMLATDTTADGHDQTGLWDAMTGDRIASLDGRFPVCSPDGRFVATSLDPDQGPVMLFDTRTQRLIGQ